MSDPRILLEPFPLRHLVLRNRIVSTSHAPAYVDRGLPLERYQRYHEEKARGGLALTMFGGSSIVSPESPASFGQIDFSSDRVIEPLRGFAKRIHAHGAFLMVQLSHMGRRSRWDAGDWLPNVSSSAVREPEHRSFPKEMEDWDIERVIRDFGEAARRAQEGGLDGLELSYNALHLVPQFWSPLVNRRTDAYGGSLENRMRLSLEILAEVRRVVGTEFIVGVRMSGDELLANGVSAEESAEIAARLAATGQVDFLNVFGGTPIDYLNLALQIPNMALPPAPFLYLAALVRSRVSIPVIQAQGISDLNTAARAVEEGFVDLVGMVRPQIADPHLVRKLSEGRVDDIRQCVAANYCIDRIYFGGEALCIQNPATGREQTMPHAIERSTTRRKVVVVGAGPAGLEAARVAASRGHAVVLFERQASAGGQLLIAQRAPGRSNLAGIHRWLWSQVTKLGVDARFGVEATAEAVQAESPDVVIVATGGRPNTGIATGAELAVSTWDVLSGAVAPGANVLVYDDQANHQGPSCAEFLASQGARVEIVTPERSLGYELGGTNFPIHLRALFKAGAIITPNVRLIEVYEEAGRRIAVLQNVYSLAEEERAVDQVVAEHGTLPNDALYFALKPHSRNRGEVDLRALATGVATPVVRQPDARFDLYRIGDAVASRNIHAAIYDGLRYCKDL